MNPGFGVRDAWANLRFFSDHRRASESEVAAFVVDDPESVEACRRLQAAEYLRRGNVTADQVTERGVLDLETDPYFGRSLYFGVFDSYGTVLASGRYITAGSGGGLGEFPTVTRLEVDQLLLEDVEQSSTIEISGLVRNRTAPSGIAALIYKEMWRYSLDAGHKWALLASTEHLYPRLEGLFGSVVTQIGPRQQLPHSRNQVIPCLINIPLAPYRLLAEIGISKGVRRRTLSWFAGFLFGDLTLEMP